MLSSLVLLVLTAGSAAIGDNGASVAVVATGQARGPAGLSPARQRLMARRGAEVVAARNLLISTGPGEFSTEMPRRMISGRLVGVVFGTPLFTSDGSCRITARFGP